MRDWRILHLVRGSPCVPDSIVHGLLDIVGVVIQGCACGHFLCQVLITKAERRARIQTTETKPSPTRRGLDGSQATRAWSHRPPAALPGVEESIHALLVLQVK